MVSKKGEFILKELAKINESFIPNTGMETYLSYDELHELLVKNNLINGSYMETTSIIKGLLEEKYIINRLMDSEYKLKTETLTSLNRMRQYSEIEFGQNNGFYISEKGYAYLQNKKYKLLSQIYPLLISTISLVVSALS